MLPSQSVMMPGKDNAKVADVEELKGKCDPSAKIQIGSVNNIKNTNKTNAHVKNSSSSSVGQNDKAEERHPDKLLRPIAPKPITIVCMPDISSVRENEMEIPGKQDIVLKNHDENNVLIKSVTAGSITKCEKDNEDVSMLNVETSILKKTSATGRSPPKIAKKKPRQIRDLEKTLNCLLSDNEQVKDEKAFAFAQSYFLKVTETLHGKDDATYGEFMKTMNDFGVTIFDATELYKKVAKIFEKYPNLAEEFLAFLLPEQAMQCGKFMEYFMITKMSSFYRKLELYYSKQPSQLRKIDSSLATLASNNKATLDDLRNTILPLLRNNSLLVNMFLELMPTEAPHASSLMNYESMDFSSVDIQNPKPEDWFETVEVPLPVEDNMYGGEGCICPCHIPEGKSRRLSTHCISCGTKFIQGRVYIHSGSMLRPARVSFKEMRNKAIERLSVKNLKTHRKIDKNQAPLSSNKKNSSSKGEATSSVSGSTNKLSPTKTKKAPKGKSLNENPKKSSKSLTPKASHTKKLGSDKKISKSPRKRIKLLTNNSESCTSSSSSGKSHLVPPKKGVSQAGKVACKEEVKICGKGGSQFSIDQTERTLRTARLAARNLILPNDSSQKSNRRQSGNIFKGESTKVITSEFLKKKPEEVFVKHKNTFSTSVSIILGKDEVVIKNSSECKDMIGANESSLMENECEGGLQIHNESVRNENEDSKQFPSDQTFKLPTSSSDFSQMKKETISDLMINIVEPESNLKEDILPLVLQKENNYIEEKQNAEEDSTENDKPVLYSKNTCVINELSLCSSQTSQDDCNTNQLSNISEVDKATELNPQHSRNLSQKGEGSKENEFIELSKSIEYKPPEDEKNNFDSEDFPCSFSSGSETEDNVQMDIDQSCEEIGKEFTSSQNDSNIDISNRENHSCGNTQEPGIGELVCPPWTRDEDKIILRTFQSVNNSEQVFQKICHELPSRTAEEVRSRFQTLMTFLEKMTDD